MFYKFPIDFVYWKQVGNHKKIKEKLLPAILNKKRETINPPNGWECNVNTSFNMGSEFNNFLVDDEIISEVIWKPLDNMFEQLDHSVPIPEESIIDEGWYSVYDGLDEHQEVHSHLSSKFYRDGIEYYTSYSAIYLLELQEEKNSTVFYSPAPHTGMEPFYPIAFNPSSKHKIEEGTVFIFPSHILHYVNPSKNNRTTISYNIASKS